MNIEMIGDRDFTRSVREHDGVWVLFSGQTVYMLEVEGGRGLPVWSFASDAEIFASKHERSGLTPVFVPLDYLLGASWLGSQKLNIVEVLASPKYGHQALVYTTGELSEKLKT